MDDKAKALIEQDRIELMEQLERVVGKRDAVLWANAPDTEINAVIAGVGLNKVLPKWQTQKGKPDTKPVMVLTEVEAKELVSNFNKAHPEVAKTYTHANDIGRVIVSIVNVMQSKRKMHEEDLPTITAAVRQAFNAGRRWGNREAKGESS